MNSNNVTPTAACGVCHIFLFKFHPLSNNPEAILFVLGAGMVVRSRFAERAALAFNFRNIAIIMASLAGFAMLSEWVNMIVGIVFLVFCSAFAGTSYSIRRNIFVSATLVGIAFLFQKGLGLQLPLY